MKIAIIGTGNVGGTLAGKWADAGHRIFLGVRDPEHFKGRHLLDHSNIAAHPIKAAVAASEVILIATPAQYAINVAKSLGDTSGKVIIDSMNLVRGVLPGGFTNTSEAILANTQTDDLAKCFNTTGYNNMEDTTYDNHQIDAFTCGASVTAKQVAIDLSRDAGFGECYDIGGNDKFQLMEQFAFFWINLAMMQGQGRDIAFKLLRR